MKQAQSYVGSAIDSQEAAQGSDVIAVAQIIEPGRLDPGPPGHALHSNGKIRVVRSLRGKLAGIQTIEFLSRGLPVTSVERVPVAGEEFIFFLRQLPSGSLQAIKMLPPTKQNVKETVRLGRAR